MLPSGYEWADPEEYGEQAERLAKKEINILSNRDVYAIVVDEYEDVVAVLLVGQDKSTFTFDIVVHPKHRRKGLARELAKVAMEEYRNLKDAYGDDYEIEVDVINPNMRKILEDLGFKVKSEPKKSRVLMTYEESIAAGSSRHIHVAPWSRWGKIKKEGLKPGVEVRGFAVDDAEEPRIYLFEDRNTAEDGLMAWMMDLAKFESETHAAMIQVDTTGLQAFDDPELSGSFYVKEAIPPSKIKLLEKVELGDPDEYEDEDVSEGQRSLGRTLSEMRGYLAKRFL